MILKNNLIAFFIKIVLPALIAILLFIIAFYAIIIPEYEKAILDKKRDMIQQLTNLSWNILEQYHSEEKKGTLTKKEAQNEAVKRIENFRYGEEDKDYFWITDMHPNMVMHPYRKDLNGHDLSDFKDPRGKKLFLVFVDTVRLSDEGFVDYMWQWKDDSDRIVPKLSYVKVFRPWGWIIGTGIYVEDVKEEIRAIEFWLFRITFVIVLIITALLFLIALQSFGIERKRQKAEIELHKSREKYKTLVDTSTEGLLMVSDDNIIYSNTIIQKILGYDELELTGKNIENIMPDKYRERNTKILNEISEKPGQPVKFVSALTDKNNNVINAEIVVLIMLFGSDKVLIYKIKDLGVEEKDFSQELNQFKTLTDNINFGVFRITFGTKGRFIELNPATLNIIGFDDKESLYQVHFFDLFYDRDEIKKLLEDLSKDNLIRNRIVRLVKRDGALTTVALSTVLIKDKDGIPLYFDCIMEDITERKQKEERQENLIMELQASLMFLNQPVVHFLKDSPGCNIHLSIYEAAKLMSLNNSDSILIKTERGDAVGLVTDRDIRYRAVAGGIENNQPVYTIMSSPLVSITERALLYEAISMMYENKIDHLGVKNADGKIISILSNEELLQIQNNSLSFMKREIENETSVIKISEIYQRLPLFINSLLNSGADAHSLTRITAVVADIISKRLLELAINELGEPPARFAFIALGSEGREENTLATDQDNAIIFEDIAEDRLESVNNYFDALGSKVCDWLNTVGYDYCEGDIMSKNRKWCKPLSVWKEYFSKWIKTSEPQDLLEIKIFFDFRMVFGDENITLDLRKHINQLLSVNPSFFLFMTNNLLGYKPPISFLGNIQLGAKEHPDSFDIKQSMIPFVDMARLYCLKYEIAETNTLSRLKRLEQKGVFTVESVNERTEAYKHLMQMRFKHQTELISEKIKPDNYINPRKLSNIEQVMLKKIFTQINDFQSKLSYDFKGMIN